MRESWDLLRDQQVKGLDLNPAFTSQNRLIAHANSKGCGHSAANLCLCIAKQSALARKHEVTAFGILSSQLAYRSTRRCAMFGLRVARSSCYQLVFKLNTATAPAFSRSSKPFLDSLKLLGMAGVSRSVPNIGTLIIRIGSWGPLYTIYLY